MSKSDTPLRKIDTSRSRNQLGKPTFAEGKAVNALDTETTDGDIFAIGLWRDTGTYSLTDNDGAPVDGLEILEAVTRDCMRSAINVWYNLSFDAQVLLKALPDENIEDIQFKNTTTLEKGGKEWNITYIPKKMLEIRSATDDVYRHFDISQFTYCKNLETSAQEWLGIDEGKLSEDVDVVKFGAMTESELDEYDDLDEWTSEDAAAYISDNYADIRRYLRRDCEITHRVAKEVIETAESLDPAIPFGQPYSTGYVAADYIRNRLENKPGYASATMQEAAWKCFGGGRFEVIKRGNVGPVAGPDINSAYPAIMSELPDPRSLEWQELGTYLPMDTERVEAADYGFLKVTMSTDPDRPVQPFPVKNPDEGNRVEYPALDEVTLWVILDTFRFARDAGIVTDFEIHEAHLGFETEATERPYSFFKDLYAQRKAFEAEGKDKAAKLLKIVMNSIFGKTCQTNAKMVDIDDISIDEIREKELRTVVGPSGNPYVEDFSAGRLFNPFLAAYITGRTRLQLLKGVVENGLEENVVLLATDCLMFEADAFNGSDLHEAAEYEPSDPRDALGGWDYDYEGNGFVIGSGVYEVTNDDGEIIKKAVRGFKELYKSDATLAAQAADNPGGIPVENTRPQTIGDVLHVGGSLSDVGVFKKTRRTLSPDMDTKRQWENESPTFADLLEGVEGSKAKVISGTDDK